MPLLVTGIFLYRSAGESACKIVPEDLAQWGPNNAVKKGVGSNLGSNFRPANFTGSKFEPKLR
jgi:hypothetical protein